MRRNELAADLRQPYSRQRGYGIARVAKQGYENVWFVVPPAPPRDVPPGLGAGTIAKANAILQGRPALDEASDLDRLAAYLFARREAVTSSRMEGTWSTVDHALTPDGDDEHREGRSAHLSVRGYAAAVDEGLDAVGRRGIRALTVDLVCRLHARIMSKDPGFRGTAGRLRAPGQPSDVIQIGAFGRREEAVYNPAPPEHVARCLEEVLAWTRDKVLIEMGDAGMGLSLPLRMAIGHAHFEAVHPFSDGNGRIGRILWPLQMAAAGRIPLYLSGYVEVRRDAYNAALAEAQKRLSYAPICDFVASAVIASQDEETAGKAEIAALPEQWQARARFRRRSAAQRALGLLTRMPIVTARTLARELEVSVQAASLAINGLAGARIIRERTGKGRNRIFAAEEVIAVLARPFGEDPEIAMEMARRTLGLLADGSRLKEA